jgi:hypothetical protein
LPAKNSGRLFDGFFRHVTNVASLHLFNQAMLHIYFHSIAR